MISYRGHYKGESSSTEAQHLVLCPINNFAQTLDLGKDRFCGSGPYERLGMLIPMLCVSFDLGFEVGYRIKRATTNSLTGNLTEPDFDLIEPRSIGRCVVHMIARATGKPSLDFRMLVGAIVVHH